MSKPSFAERAAAWRDDVEDAVRRRRAAEAVFVAAEENLRHARLALMDAEIAESAAVARMLSRATWQSSAEVLVSARDDQGRRHVTVDTGGPDDVFPGAVVTWLHVPRGGYGYVMPVDGKVLSVGRTKVRIEVKSSHGTKLVRSVMPAHLRWSGR